jgi:hypothetical protein
MTKHTLTITLLNIMYPFVDKCITCVSNIFHVFQMIELYLISFMCNGNNDKQKYN